ncbi:MAG: hypothetical protein ACRD2G_06320 [Terriglobia bacterium]
MYRVLVSKDNMHLVREGPDGITKPFLFDKGKFVENVDLKRVSPDIAGVITSIAIQATLTEVCAKLNTIVTTVDNLTELVRLVNLGALDGALHALQVARQLNDAKDRRRQMLAACQQMLVQLGSVAGQMGAHVNQMLPADTGFWIGWKKNRITIAEKAYALVRDDLVVLAEGLRQTVTAYAELGQFDAASEAFGRICDRIETSVRRGADCARLLPYSSPTGPEEVFGDFLSGRPAAEARLEALANGIQPDLRIVFERSEIVA